MTGTGHVATTVWVKARRSGGNGGDCVQMRRNGAAVQLRDSKHPDGDVLSVPAAQFAAWLRGARRGEYPATT